MISKFLYSTNTNLLNTTCFSYVAIKQSPVKCKMFFEKKPDFSLFLCICPSYHNHYHFRVLDILLATSFSFLGRTKSNAKSFTAGLTDIKKIMLKMPSLFEAIIAGLPIWFESSKMHFMMLQNIFLAEHNRGTQSKWFV